MLSHTHAALDWSDPAILMPMIQAVASVLVALITVLGSAVSVWLYWWLRRRKRGDPPKKKPKPRSKRRAPKRQQKGRARDATRFTRLFAIAFLRVALAKKR